MATPLNPDQIEHARTLRANGQSLATIATLLNVSKSAVARATTATGAGDK
jgi:DNA invertase Pin-like site-specific DNA recombinase